MSEIGFISWISDIFSVNLLIASFEYGTVAISEPKPNLKVTRVYPAIFIRLPG